MTTAAPSLSDLAPYAADRVDLTTLPAYRRLYAQYTEAAARAVTEDDRLRFRGRRDQLAVLPHRVADDPGSLPSVRAVLEAESRRTAHWIALQISRRLV